MEAIKNTAINKNSQGRSRIEFFQPADVLIDFDAEFLSADLCQAWVMERLHPNKICCPRCGANVPERLMHSFWDCKRIKCDCCGKYFTALTDTFLSGCHFDFREIVLLALLLALGVADKQIAMTLKISAENVRLWRHRFEAISQAQKIFLGCKDGN